MANIEIKPGEVNISLPGGTVTFLFTDIEGSTKLLKTLHEQYALVLGDQRDLLRAAFAKWNGHEIDTQGDAFFVAFSRASDALNCVIEAQRAIATHTWPQNLTVSVRMGLYTGEPIIARTGYIGLDVHRAARIASAGYGGQVLLSQTTRDLIYQDLPKEVSLHDLGSHKLKDIRYPQQIYQLDIAGLPVEFPPLKTLATGDEPPTPGESPYKGLRYFDEADADLFFGREVLTAGLVKAISKQRFLAVVGGSGSGKSSIVRAGLIPALRRAQHQAADQPTRESPTWDIYILTPTAHPLEALALSLTQGAESIASAAALIDDLSQDERSLHLFVRKMLYNRASDDKQSRARRMLLIVDQFEELFTLCREESERTAFIDNLLYAAGVQRGPTSVLVTLRADFYEHLSKYSHLREAVAKHQEYIGAMNAEELRQVIERPAELGGWEFHPGLVDLILYDVGATEDRQPEPGALPLLSHALLETWKQRRGEVMTLKAYSESGGVRGAIAHTAERVYYGELTPEQQEIARRIFLRLTEIGEGTQDTRRRVALDELIPAGTDVKPSLWEKVLVKLADARLVTTSKGTVEVAHEALIREWPTLQEWLAQDREGLRMHRHLTEASQEWELLEHDPGALYRGARLAQALEWAEANLAEMNALERAFLEASRETAERKQAERDRRRRRTILALAGGLLITLILALVAFQQRQDSLQQAGILLASQAEAELEAGYADRAVLLGLEALENYPYSAQAEHALAQAVTKNRLRLYLSQHEAALTDVAWSPHGTFLATAGGVDQTAVIWDASTGEELLTLADHPSFVLSLAWSPDGKRLATISGNWWAVTGFAGDSEEALERSKMVTITIWDVVGGEKLLELTSRKTSQAIFADMPSTELYRVTGAAWSPDGKYITAIAGDERTIIWDAATGEELFTVPGLESAVNSVAWSPDGSELLTATLDGTIAIWPIQNAQDASRRVGDPFILSGHTGSVWNASWSPGGRRILSAGDDGTARIWDAETGESLLSISGGTGAVWDAAYSPSSDTIVTAREDGIVRTWDAATGEEQLKLIGHEGSLAGVSWSPSGRELASAGRDGTARVWKVTPYTELLTLSDENTINTVAWSPTGDRIITGGGSFADDLLNGSVKMWDAATGEVIMTLVRDVYDSSQATWSPDGIRILTRDTVEGEEWPPCTVRVWDSATGELLTVLSGVHHLEGFAALVRDAAWSPDGTRIADAIFDGIAAVYDAATGEVLVTLTEHEGLVFTVDWSPDGKRLATGDMSNTTRIWDVESGAELMTLMGTQDGISGVNWVAWSPSGDRILTTHGNPEVGGADTSIRIWDTKTGELLSVIYGHTEIIWMGGWSPNEQRIFSVSMDGTVRVWDANSGAEILTLATPTEWYAHAAWSPDGTRLVTAHASNTAEVWRVWQTTGELIEYAHECCAVRQFTLEERAQYGLPER